MPMYGIIKFTRDELANELESPRMPASDTDHARFTIGMLHDMLDRIDWTIETRKIKRPPELIHATVKVCAGAIAVIIMELSKEGTIDECIKISSEQFQEEIGKSLAGYREVFEKHQKREWL